MTYEDDDEIDDSGRKRRRMMMMVYFSKFMASSVMAYQEFKLNKRYGGNQPHEVIEHRHNKRSKRRTFDPTEVSDTLQRKRLGPDVCIMA